jgi:hypothetical protein
MSDLFSKTVCISKSCGWNAFSRDVGCSSGNSSCLLAEVLVADESEFHTADLQEASAEIREILSKIKRRRGRKLAFLGTPFGVLLAWVRHDIKVPDDAITSESSPKEIKKALGLKGVLKSSKKSGRAKTASRK